MTDNTDTLDLPPFPPMSWIDCDGWNGTVVLSFGSETAFSVMPYDPTVSRTPADYQRDAMRFVLEHGDQVYAAVLGALRFYYNDMRPKYRSFLDREFDSLMPALAAATDLSHLIDLQHIYIHPWTKDGMGYFGLQFGCTWDQDHGLGLLMHRDRVVDIGGADVSFAWSPDEAD